MVVDGEEVDVADGGVAGGGCAGMWPMEWRMRKFEGELVNEVRAVEYLLSWWRNIVSSAEVDTEDRGVIVAIGRAGGLGVF